VYLAYSLVRSALGGSADLAEDNAERIISLERALGILHERSIQRFLDDPSVIRPLNTFYSLAHFSVTLGVLLWLFLRRRGYSLRRNAIMATTAIALVGYALFPLMPPRLYPRDGIIDSLAVFGAPWTYQRESAGAISNQFAAMPSLHVAWAMWCTWAVWQEVRRPWVRAVAIAYSTIAIVAVIATGNHFVLDIAGAALVLAAGVAIARWLAGRSEGSAGDELPGASVRDQATRSRRSAAKPGPDPRARSVAVVAAVDGDHVSRVVAAGATGEVDREAPEVVG
jgi:hypothetical protein